MAKRNVNTDEWKELLEKLSAVDTKKIMTACSRDISLRLLNKTIKRTPVGIYPPSSGKLGGTLRRNWTLLNGNSVDVTTYVQQLQIKVIGDTYITEISNPTEYASYVEYGHRTAFGNGWVKGRFMLTLSEKEIQRDMPLLIDKQIKKYLSKVFE